MSVDPVDNDGIITFLGAPSVRGEAPVEKLQLTGHEWVGFAFNLCFGTTPGMIVYRATDQGDQTRSDWVALPPSGIANQVLTNGTGNQVLWGDGGSGGGCALGIKVISDSSYTVLNTDECYELIFTASGDVLVTLPEAGAGGEFTDGWHSYFKNGGTGFVTITPTTSAINGTGILSLSPNQSVHIISNSGNYDGQRDSTGGLATDSSVIAGQGNTISSLNTCSAIVGGVLNQITNDGQNGFIGGGAHNQLDSNEADGSAIVGGAYNYATGAYSAVLGGLLNQVNSYGAIAGGDHSVAANNSFVGGGAFNDLSSGSWCAAVGGTYAKAGTRYGGTLLGSGSSDDSTAGEAQTFRTVLRATSTGLSPVRLTWSGQLAQAETTCALEDNTSAAVNITLKGRAPGSGEHVVLTCFGALIVRDSGVASTTIIGSPSFTVSSATAGATTTVATLTADTTHGSPNISVTPPTNEVWNWSCSYEAVEGI